MWAHGYMSEVQLKYEYPFKFNHFKNQVCLKEAPLANTGLEPTALVLVATHQPSVPCYCLWKPISLKFKCFMYSDAFFYKQFVSHTIRIVLL